MQENQKTKETQKNQERQKKLGSARTFGAVQCFYSPGLEKKRRKGTACLSVQMGLDWRGPLNAPESLESGNRV